jgi:hypothetical protein
MELSYLLFTGSLSGLVSILGHSVIASIVEFASRRKSGMSELQVQVSELFLHMAFGVTLGLLFWLSWGLAAIVQVTWWLRGLAFGGLAALALAPALLNMLLSRGAQWQLLAVIASRWLTTCLVVGLSCAWTWRTL